MWFSLETEVSPDPQQLQEPGIEQLQQCPPLPFLGEKRADIRSYSLALCEMIFFGTLHSAVAA